MPQSPIIPPSHIASGAWASLSSPLGPPRPVHVAQPLLQPAIPSLPLDPRNGHELTRAAPAGRKLSQGGRDTGYTMSAQPHGQRYPQDPPLLSFIRWILSILWIPGSRPGPGNGAGLKLGSAQPPREDSQAVMTRASRPGGCESPEGSLTPAPGSGRASWSRGRRAESQRTRRANL